MLENFSDVERNNKNFDVRVTASSKKFGVFERKLKDLNSTKNFYTKIQHNKNLTTLRFDFDQSDYDRQNVMHISKLISQNKGLQSLRLTVEISRCNTWYRSDGFTKEVILVYRNILKKLRCLKYLKLDLSYGSNLKSRDLMLFKSSFSRCKDLKSLSLYFDCCFSLDASSFRDLSYEVRRINSLQHFFFSAYESYHLSDGSDHLLNSLCSSKKLKSFIFEIHESELAQNSLEKFAKLSSSCPQVEYIGLGFAATNIMKNHFELLGTCMKKMMNLSSLAIDLTNAYVQSISNFFESLVLAKNLRNFQLKLFQLNEPDESNDFLKSLIFFLEKSSLHYLDLEFGDLRIPAEFYQDLDKAIAIQLELRTLKLKKKAFQVKNVVFWPEISEFKSLEKLEELVVPINEKIMKNLDSSGLFETLGSYKKLSKLNLNRSVTVLSILDQMNFFKSLGKYMEENLILKELVLTSFELEEISDAESLRDALKSAKYIEVLDIDFPMSSNTFGILSQGIGAMNLVELKITLYEDDLMASFLNLEIVLSQTKNLKTLAFAIFSEDEVDESALLQISEFFVDFLKKFPKLKVKCEKKTFWGSDPIYIDYFQRSVNKDDDEYTFFEF